MGEYEDSVFNNLPRRRRRLEDDNTRSGFREALGMYVPEGPLPPRPHPSGKGGPSLGTSNSPPINSGTPVVTGIPAVGQTLTCDKGAWFYGSTYTYQWNGVAGSPTTNPTYTVVAGDLGHTISCTVTATNAHGSASATSNAVLIGALPANTSPPVISGATAIGSTLTLTSPGVWSGSPTYTYLWSGAGSPNNGSTYVTVTADGGTSVTCQVTATNAVGSASQASNAIAVAGGAAVQTVWSASDAAAGGMTLSNGGLTVAQTSAAGWQSIRGTTSKTSGKWYVEFVTSTGVNTVNSGNIEAGLASAGFNVLISGGGYLGSNNYSFGDQIPYAGDMYASAGFTVLTSHIAIPIVAGDVIGMAVDFAAQELWISHNNTWLTGNPATGANPLASFVLATTGALFPAMSFNLAANAGVWTIQTETALGRARRLAENHND